MKKELILTAFALTFHTLVLQAQTSVKGYVLDEQHKPIEFANVILLAKNDSTLLVGNVTNSLGGFLLNTQSSAPAFLRVSSIGYNTRTYSLPLSTDTLFLQADTKQMDGVTITSQRPKMMVKNDALITSIAGSSLAKLGSANDVLKHIPMLQGKDGNYSVIGKGNAVIYINNRKVTDNSEIERLNSADIKDIEVVTNPGARYDATVRAVIRIHTIKRVGDGFGFDVRSSVYEGGHGTDFIDQLNARYRYKGFEVAANTGYYLYDNQSKSDILQETKTTALWQQEMHDNGNYHNLTYSTKISLSYDFNKNHSIGASFLSEIEGKNNCNEEFLNTSVRKNNVEVDHVKGYAQGHDYSLPNKLVNFYYTGQVGKLNIDFNTDYFFTKGHSNTTQTEEAINSDNRIIHSNDESTRRFYATKLVLSYPLFGGNFSLGNENTISNFEQSYTNEEGYVPNAHSKIKEKNNAFFIEYTHNTKIGTFGAGVRYEHVNSDYYDKGIYVEGQSRTYSQWFPTLNYATKIKNVNLQLAYTSKTVRPAYSQLSNSVIYANRFTMQSGNPLLTPERIYDLTLTANWKWLTFVGSYNETHNKIMYWTEQNPNTPEVSTIKYRNIDNYPTLMLTGVVSPTIGIWEPQLTLIFLKQ